MSEHRTLQDIPAYALGALSTEDKERVESHLKEGCEVCESEYTIFSEVTNRIPYGLPDVKLNPALKEKIWERINAAEIQDRKIDGPRALNVYRIAAAFVIGSLVLAIVAFQFRRNERLKSEIAQLENELSRQEQTIQIKETEIAWLKDPNVQFALLSGLNDFNGSARVVWNPEQSRGFFYAKALPPLPGSQSYQLWLIDARGPASAGVFSSDTNGKAMLSLSSLTNPQGENCQFAVTIEPHGGVPQPTGSMVLLGKSL